MPEQMRRGNDSTPLLRDEGDAVDHPRVDDELVGFALRECSARC
jgi:hypothetical protein